MSIDLITEYGISGLILLIVFSLSIGSFLGVIVHRFPKILAEYESTDTHLFALLFKKNTNNQSLAFPSSTCDKCGSPIRIHEKIPLLSYLLLNGKCAYCDQSIPKIYPTIELTTCLISLAMIAKFGFSAQALVFLLLSWMLISASFMDITQKLLPDQITLPLIWIGLITNVAYEFTPIHEAILGAVVGYLSLWVVFWLYKLLRKKEAIGYGDFKLLSVVGSWLGVYALSWVLLIAAFTGLVFGLYRVWSGRQNFEDPIAFGPFISFSCLFFLLFKEQFIMLISY